VSFYEAFAAAVGLLATLDPHVVAAAAVSLRVAMTATILATILGAPIGFWVATRQFRGRRTVEVGLKTLTAFPTVIVGLLTYMLVSRRGPFGALGLLYTQWAIIAGETILVTPLLAALTMAVVGGADPRIEDTALTLGASRMGAALTVLSEVRHGFIAAVVTGFGRLISELGVALMVGGNIAGSTRTMTTAIALETSKGEFALAFAIGLLLLTVALAVNVMVAALTPAR
jgi:tungstate transport system permease protein